VFLGEKHWDRPLRMVRGVTPPPDLNDTGPRQLALREGTDCEKTVVRHPKTARGPAKEPALLTGSSAPKEATPTLESEIGAEVRRLRKSFDLTVAELGVAWGMSAGMLSKIENDSISFPRPFPHCLLYPKH
jgi:hypothetical protein